MKCPACEIEMVIYAAEKKADGKTEVTYACRNPKCPHYDGRLKKEAK